MLFETLVPYSIHSVRVCPRFVRVCPRILALQIPTDDRCMRRNARNEEEDEKNSGERGSDEWGNVCVWSVTFTDPPV